MIRQTLDQRYFAEFQEIVQQQNLQEINNNRIHFPSNSIFNRFIFSSPRTQDVFIQCFTRMQIQYLNMEILQKVFKKYSNNSEYDNLQLAILLEKTMTIFVTTYNDILEECKNFKEANPDTWKDGIHEHYRNYFINYKYEFLYDRDLNQEDIKNHDFLKNILPSKIYEEFEKQIKFKLAQYLNITL